MLALHFINVYSTIIMMPVVALALLPWPFRDIGMIFKRRSGKDNWMLKIYRFLMKIHIPLGIYILVFGIFHTIFASINHGWGFNWGMVTMFFFAFAFVIFLFRKKIGRAWVPIHRFAEYAATGCMFIHCIPALTTIFTVIAPMFWHAVFG